MQKTRAELSLIWALLLGSLATCGAAPCGLADASSLLQQRAATAPTSHFPAASGFSMWSNKTALMVQLEEFKKEAEMHSEEKGIRFYEAVWRLANLSGVRTEEKGLMLVQEAGKIFGDGTLDKIQEHVRRFERWTGRSQGISCYSSGFNLLAQTLGAVFSALLTIKCPKSSEGGKLSSACFSDGIESVRYILVSAQNLVAMPYCAETYQAGKSCLAAIAETSTNAAGMASASTAITYKCPEHAVNKSNKVGKLRVNGIRCALGFGKSGLYLGTAILKLYEWSVNTESEEVAEGYEHSKFYAGQPSPSSITQFGATVAWIAHIIFLMGGHCGRGTDGIAVCRGEIAELVAHIAQTFTGLLMGYSYCHDPYNGEDVMGPKKDYHMVPEKVDEGDWEKFSSEHTDPLDEDQDNPDEEWRTSSGTGGPHPPTGSDARQVIVENVDYVDFQGGEDVVEAPQTVESCCKLCANRNTEKPGSCAVVVLSSGACRIKAGVGQPVSKHGVVACLPAPPTLGNSEGSVDQEARKERLQALVALSPQNGPPSIEVLRKRSQALREAIQHAWKGYEEHAWGKDALKPIIGLGVDSKFHLAVTMVDSLDTLWIVGLRDEFNKARDWLAHTLPSRIRELSSASAFETTIRSLGGLLSAFDLSRDQVFLDLASELGRRIQGIIQDNGVAPYRFNGGQGGNECNTLTDSGSNQLELRYLAHVTGDPSFAEKANKFYDTVQDQKSVDGLWPNCFLSGKGKISFGADGDSFYEYLLKVWLQGGKTETRLWDLYRAAVRGLRKHLISRGEDGLDYIGQLNWNGQQPQGEQPQSELVDEMEHLTCFVPGWLALGAQSEEPGTPRESMVELAGSIAKTCWQMYEKQPTGIAPERVKHRLMDLSRTDTREYILRPEAIEGWWYMHELTQDPRYREWGWRTFQAFERELWVPNGYASLKDVTDPQQGYIDRMDSFFLAETMKYLFLLQDPDHRISLDRYVFNTEGHPLSFLALAPQALTS